MENQHRIIKGYRDLLQGEIDLMNEIKAKGEELRVLCEKVQAHISSQWEATSEPDENGLMLVDSANPEWQRLELASPDSWLWDARRELQSGLMKLVRSVAQPTGF